MNLQERQKERKKERETERERERGRKRDSQGRKEKDGNEKERTPIEKILLWEEQSKDIMSRVILFKHYTQKITLANKKNLSKSCQKIQLLVYGFIWSAALSSSIKFSI